MRRFLILTFSFISILFLTAASYSEDRETELLKAYKREYMFLTMQKKSLSEELKKLQKQLTQLKQQNKKELEKLQSRYISLKAKADRIEKLIEDIQQQLTEIQENKELVEATIAHAEETLKSYGIDLVRSKYGRKIPEELILKDIFNQASKLIKDLSSVKKVEGDFFLPDGRKTTGNIIRVGSIASYGISEDNRAGILIPAGEGLFTLWAPEDNPLAEKTAKALLDGEDLKEIGIFLYEDPDKPLEPPEQTSLKEFIESGGVVGYIIIALGLLGVILILFRLFILLRANTNTTKVTNNVIEYIKQNNLSEAIEYCEKTSGVVPKVIAYILKHINRDRESLEYIITEALLHYSGKLDLFKNSLITIAAVSPLLGLLGTVTGIIETFHVITEFGTGDPKLMAGGISEALVTTELGLIVAIPVYIVGSLLNGFAEKIKESIEEASLKIINVYDELRGMTR